MIAFPLLFVSGQNKKNCVCFFLLFAGGGGLFLSVCLLVCRFCCSFVCLLLFGLFVLFLFLLLIYRCRAGGVVSASLVPTLFPQFAP